MSHYISSQLQEKPFSLVRRMLNGFNQEIDNYRLVGANHYVNKGVENRINLDGCTFDHSTLVVDGNNNEILIAPKTRLSYLDIYLRGNNHRLVIGGDCYLQGRIELLGTANTISIGQSTTTFNVFLGAFEENRSIEIGEDCLFSGWIDIRTGDSHGIIDETGQRVNLPDDVKIGNHVWIGQRVLVLKGASIGDNAIIGAGAVVSRPIPAHAIAVGVPAKVVKTGVNWVRDLDELTSA